MFKDSCKEMLIRLGEVAQNMQSNQAILAQIKASKISVESHAELYNGMSQLTLAS